MKAIDSYPVKFQRSGKPLTQSDISACADELGLAFPASYTEFMLNHNGGSPSPAYLPYPGSATKVQRFFSITDGDLVDTCKRHRSDYGVPDHFMSIAELGGSESYLVLDCSTNNNGALLYWFDVTNGFRHRDPDYSNTTQLYFTVDQLFTKFGPAKNREDFDGMFCRLYYASSSSRHGPALATAFLEAGYDINYVLPSFRHPIFGSIDSAAYDVAETLLKLGTSPTHRDPLHNNASIADRLSDALDRWNVSLEAAKESEYPTGLNRATRNIANIQSALALLERASGTLG